MAEPTIAQKGPYGVEVEAGKTYWWCACGQSAKQPFCDGSHKGSGFAPKPYAADKDGTVYFCGCKHSEHAPLCDGGHQRL
jgi:CDGSH-type Zn-finger protein